MPNKIAWPDSFVKNCILIAHPDQSLPMFVCDAGGFVANCYLQDMAIIPLEEYEALLAYKKEALEKLF